MTYNSTVTSKGQMTLPVEFRKKLGIKPGERVTVDLKGDKVIVQKNNWQAELRKIQAANREYMKKSGIKPLADEELDEVIEQAVFEDYKRKMEQ